MAGFFGSTPEAVPVPQAPAPVPVVSPYDGANSANNALARRLAAGGTNATNVSNTFAPTTQARMPTLTGLS